MEENPSTVKVVREYLDVFPEELLGLPPDREIEFVIKLLQIFPFKKNKTINFLKWENNGI